MYFYNLITFKFVTYFSCFIAATPDGSNKHNTVNYFCIDTIDLLQNLRVPLLLLTISSGEKIWHAINSPVEPQ